MSWPSELGAPYLVSLSPDLAAVPARPAAATPSSSSTTSTRPTDQQQRHPFSKVRLIMSFVK
jgi:hypothetical protein